MLVPKEEEEARVSEATSLAESFIVTAAAPPAPTAAASETSKGRVEWDEVVVLMGLGTVYPVCVSPFLSSPFTHCEGGRGY